MLHIRHAIQQNAGLAKAAPLAMAASLTSKYVGKYDVKPQYEVYDKAGLVSQGILKGLMKKKDYYNLLQKDLKTGELDIPDKYAGRPANPATEVTVMPNGVIAVSVNTASPISSLGVFCKAGAKYENGSNAGVGQIIRHAWFGTTGRRTFVGATREPAQCGAEMGAISTRECFGVTASCLKDKTDLILDHMVQNFICPEFFEQEIKIAKSVAADETKSGLSNADMVLIEEAHRVAFKGKGLGRSLFCKPYNLDNITRTTVLDYIFENMQHSNNLVVVGLGIDHEILKAQTEEFTWSLEVGSVKAPESKYHGGLESHIETGGELVTAMLLTNGVVSGSLDCIVLDLVKVLVGASSVSPVYHGSVNSKLAFAAAEHLSQPFTTECVNINYSDGGLFGLSVCAHDTEIKSLLKSGVGVMGALTKSVSEEELSIAKIKLKSSILLQGETNASIIESTALAALNSAKSQADTLALIDGITAEDVTSMVKKVWASEPILVSVGSGENFPSLSEIL